MGNRRFTALLMPLPVTPEPTVTGDGTNNCRVVLRPQQQLNQEIRIHCVESFTQGSLVNKSHKAFDMKDALIISPGGENPTSF